MQSEVTQQISAGQLTKIRNNVVIIKYHVNRRITREDLIETQEFRRSTIGHKSFYAIMDYTEGLPSFTGQAKSFAAINKESNDLRLMDVIITKSWKTKLEIKLYKKLFKPQKPILVVSDFEEALNVVEQSKMEAEETESVSLAC